ncbi:MAG TPA: hypothetical protein VMZ11_02460 [Mycobacteriales bacterium]|nr:hypothetical protein [Mycobacteriales bacterium]
MGDHGGSHTSVRVAGGAIGLAVLAAQLAAVFYAHAVQPVRSGEVSGTWQGCSARPESCTRYFAWAPNDYLVQYELTVRTPEGLLGTAAARLRYRLGEGPWEFPVDQLKDIVRQYETTHGAGRGTVALLRYSINERPWQTWEWHA